MCTLAAAAGTWFPDGEPPAKPAVALHLSYSTPTIDRETTR